MIQNRGDNRQSFITGRSVHNQRIERLWRDVTKDVSDKYKRLFNKISDEYQVDFENPLCLYTLHHIFLDMISEDLKLFKNVGICMQSALKIIYPLTFF